MKRALIIARTTLSETLRSKLTVVAALAVLVAIPALAWLFGEEAQTRQWLSRAIPTEMLRVFLPLAAIFGGAFLVRPGVKAGWAVLPARRIEWFAGSALAGATIVMLASLIVALGAVVAGWIFGDPLLLTARASAVNAKVTAADMALADPDENETITIDPPAEAAGAIRGTLEFLPIWKQQQAPALVSPFDMYAETGGERTTLQVNVESRRRVRFAGTLEPGARIILQPTDPALIIGIAAPNVRFEIGERSNATSLSALVALCAGASLLCLFVVLAVRALSTAPTAALAGMLLLAALTLLPGLAPAEGMARDRRRDLGRQDERGVLETLGAELSGLPQLFPDSYFDEYLAGRVVPEGAALDGMARLGVGMLLLAPGAWLFTRRQIAK